MRSQVVAIVAVIACGIGTYVMSASTVQSLEETRNDYYERNRFANIFCDLKRAPESMASRLADLEGIREWETRVTTYVRVQLEGVRESPQAMIVSLPHDSQPRLNKIHLREGDFPTPHPTRRSSSAKPLLPHIVLPQETRCRLSFMES